MTRNGSLPFGCGDLADLQKHVRVTRESGEQVGIMMLSEAIKMADSESAELVAIAPNASPPIYAVVKSKDICPRRLTNRWSQQPPRFRV
jgi:hypothetical protein